MIYTLAWSSSQMIEPEPLRHPCDQQQFRSKEWRSEIQHQTLLLCCKCSRRPLNTGNLPLEVGTKGDNGLTRYKVARSMLCDCPWRVRFKKQLNDS
ncbi:hypothetical protein V1527DRAFT_476025, partial [Lipomyces starkeyi]